MKKKTCTYVKRVTSGIEQVRTILELSPSASSKLNAQASQSKGADLPEPFCCSHTQSIDIDEGSDQKFRLLDLSDTSVLFLFLNQNICCGYSKEPSQ